MSSEITKDKKAALQLRKLFTNDNLFDTTQENADTIPKKIKEFKNRIEYIKESKILINDLVHLEQKQKNKLHKSADNAIKRLRSKILELTEEYKQQISRNVEEARKDPDGSKRAAKTAKNRQKKQKKREKEKKIKAMTQWAEQFNQEDFDPENETSYPFEFDDVGPITEEEIRRVTHGGRKTKRKRKYRKKNKKSKKRQGGMRKTKKRSRRKRKKRFRRYK